MTTPISRSLPEQTDPTFCTDEDVLIRCGGDYVALVPSWQCFAHGIDGVFATGAPWVLTSATVNFQGNGVNPGQVVRLTKPSSQYQTGDLLVVDSASGNSVTLRRPHVDLYLGHPPAPATGLAGVTFTVLTMQPQIEEAAYDLKRRFGVDDMIASRSSDWMYMTRELRVANVLMTLLDRYTFEARTSQGDFTAKVARLRQQLNDVLGRIQIRWGPSGASAPPTTINSTKVSR